MRGGRLFLVLVAITVSITVSADREAFASSLTIYEIQYTADPLGSSPYDASIVDCAGGIVVDKFTRGLPKLTLQNPSYPDGWGGIQVKDWTGSSDLYDGVSVGDWVSLSNVLIEEYRGNTILQYKAENSPGFQVTSTGNPIPLHKVVAMSEIAAPIEGPPGEWYVADHSAEKYEAMLLKVENVTVTAMDLGKALDNYNLNNADGDCWGADYMNEDIGEDYHPYVHVGSHFVSVSGIFEQYTKDQWDYYQLVTTSTEDLEVLAGDANIDGSVDVGDLGILAGSYGQSGKTWTEGDFTGEGDVNVGDLGILAAHYGEHLPEPTSIALLLVSIPMLLKSRDKGSNPRTPRTPRTKTKSS